jgi:hypothetical protein
MESKDYERHPEAIIIPSAHVAPCCNIRLPILEQQRVTHVHPTLFAFPSYPPHHCPFTPVEPGYGVDLFEDDYLLLPAADLRMDPALRPRPVSSVAFAYLGNTPQLDHCPFTPVEPGYEVDLFEDDYLFLLPAADLRMDPALRPRPVSSVAFAYPGDTPQLGGKCEGGCTIETQ